VAAVAAQPGIEIEGSGIAGTDVRVHLTGPSGEFFVLYFGLLAQPTRSWSGQQLGIGPYPIPVSAGQFGSSGKARFKFPVPDVPALIGKAMAFFQFETFELKLVPPSFVAKNVSPGAYFVLAPPGSGNPTRFGTAATDSALGSTVKLSCAGQPGDFLLGYYGNIALPVMLPDGTNVCALPPIPFTPLLARLDGQGTLATEFKIPEIPGLVGTNICLQFQTFSLAGFPPQLVLKDSSCCLLLTVKEKG
jgi:hypothetical protein